MHANIQQFLKKTTEHGQPLNNVILLTPNESMSQQHLTELQSSGLPAQMFRPDLLAHFTRQVQVLDLNKLAEVNGVKRVAVTEFGDNNLVMVDEGHLGSTGKVWRELREELANGGFTFEYSATFNQIVNKRGNDEFFNHYSKCLIFDYPYSQFFEDGYGKNFEVSNLPLSISDHQSYTYLLGCLLTFYQQYRIWFERRTDWREFNVTKPLLVFLGKRVIADSAPSPEVISIIEFLGWLLRHGEEVIETIRLLTSGNSGLESDEGADYFDRRFDYLASIPSDSIYDDLCTKLFHGKGRLQLVHLAKGGGEIHLNTSDNPTFGLINVGDSKVLFDRMDDRGNPDIDLRQERGFVDTLFHELDSPASQINVVIGAKRFIAGWNSWRVGTMGLIHVGRQEGPEIIQMFGRGVRLKGWNMSLKRHPFTEAEPPKDSNLLADLETLHIFGLRADYIQLFKGILEEEGVNTLQHARLRLLRNSESNANLKIFRVRGGQQYERSNERPMIRFSDRSSREYVLLNLYPKIRSFSSNSIDQQQDQDFDLVSLPSEIIRCLDVTRIYDGLMKRKTRNSWSNFVIDVQLIEEMLRDNAWYDLHIPANRLTPNSYSELIALEDVVVELIATYIRKVWRKQRRNWEHRNLEVSTLDEHDPNQIDSYELTTTSPEINLEDAIGRLEGALNGDYFKDLNLGVILAQNHAYQPLLYSDGESALDVYPMELNANEHKVIHRLTSLVERKPEVLDGFELFTLRNLSKGHGISFFDDIGYYPDFIVWLYRHDLQHIVFLDPKGLSRFGEKERMKTELHFGIKEVEANVQNLDPSIRLHAYVLSVTPPNKIGGDGNRSAGEWRQRGVYFLQDSDCLEQVINDVLHSQ